MGVVPGNRVLLRAPNNPMMAACWFAVMKAGAIAVATMPLLRAKELATIIDKAKVSHALCDARLADDLSAAVAQAPSLRVKMFDDASGDGLEAAMARQPDAFRNVDTAADDTCILAFTSGTTGVPKATMHFHRDVMAICKCFPPHVLRARRRRRLLRQPAARVHFRPRRAPAVSDEHRRVDAARRKAVARRAARRHPLRMARR
jgi:2-aminobenzoate-CoA ligase